MSPNLTFGTGQPGVGPCPKFLVTLLDLFHCNLLDFAMCVCVCVLCFDNLFYCTALYAVKIHILLLPLPKACLLACSLDFDDKKFNL